MWKWKEDEKPASPAPPAQPPVRAAAEPLLPRIAPKEVRAVESPKPQENFRADVAHIGKSVIVKGELSGSEDLYLDGEVEGNIELHGHSLIVGPNGRVRANIHARDVVIHGKVDGNVQGAERVELKKSAILSGDILTQRIVIEDGAYFKGGIDIQKETKPEVKTEPKAEVKHAAAALAPGGSTSLPAQPALMEIKK